MDDKDLIKYYEHKRQRHLKRAVFIERLQIIIVAIILFAHISAAIYFLFPAENPCDTLPDKEFYFDEH